MIIRAIGPELTRFGIPDALANPRVELHNGSGALIGSNDDWQTTIIGGVITTNQVSDIQNSGHAPTAASESAIIANLQPGNYTAIVRGVSNANGVGLVEVYDLSPVASSNLSNISTRSFVQTGEHVMIGGFIVQGGGPKRVIIRAIGPELTQFGIPDALANPRLELHNGSGALVATNDDWQTTIIGGIITSSQLSDIQNSGHGPTAASESAIIANLQPGNYTAVVRGVNNTVGVALVEVYDLSPGASSTLGNISTRSFVQTGEHVMIGGFIVQGSGPKRVIIRAIGPELTQFGIPDALANPTLELHNGSGALIASNDNWQTTILGGIITSNQVSDIQNSGHAPTAASESAIIANLQPGNYTAIVRGVSNTNGVGLVEVYDLSPVASSNLSNISTRSFVQTGEHVMIGGFIVQGSGPKRVIIRAIGPELTQFGIPDALANPTLELHNGSGALIASNDNWQTTIIGGIITSNQVSDIQNSGHAPTAPSESAIIANLQPGNYTAIVRGVNNTLGVALVEVYDLSAGASSSLGNISTRS